MRRSNVKRKPGKKLEKRGEEEEERGSEVTQESKEEGNTDPSEACRVQVVPRCILPVGVEPSGGLHSTGLTCHCDICSVCEGAEH